MCVCVCARARARVCAVFVGVCLCTACVCVRAFVCITHSLCNPESQPSSTSSQYPPFILHDSRTQSHIKRRCAPIRIIYLPKCVDRTFACLYVVATTVYAPLAHPLTHIQTVVPNEVLDHTLCHHIWRKGQACGFMNAKLQDKC